MIRPATLCRAALAAALLLLTTPPLAAEDADLANDDRIAELERKVEILSEELERTRTEMALPEEPALESVHGLGPAASKVYGLARGLSPGGYAEACYTAFVADKGDKKNEIHEPPFYFGTHRPDTERRIIPSTWRENGAGLFGSLLGDQLEYKLYVVNGFDASGFGASGLRGGRQKGSKALAEDFAVVGYAFIDVHTVRTLPEAFLIVLNPQGAIRTLCVLAFHEPLEYKPSDRWYNQFEGKSLAEPLRLGGDVHGVVGATLSARATTRGVRRALALYEVVVQNAH